MKRAALRIALFALIAVAVPPSCARAQSFKDSYRIPLASDPAALAAGDLNGDGIADFVWIDGSTQPLTIRVLLSQAAGGWLPGTSIPFTQTITRFTGCLLVDVNNDKRLDLVCADADQFTIYIHVFLGNGDGTFQAPIATIVTSQTNGAWAVPTIYPVGDLNGDGFVDLYEQEAQSQEAQILLSDGNGGFKTPIPAPAGANLSQPVAADVNGDGIPDLLFPMGPEVALGKGDGSFGPIQNYANVSYFTAMCVFHDMDGDGHLDAVCGYPETTTGDITGATDLIVLHGNPDGSFNTTPIAQKRFGDYNNEFDGFGTFLMPLAVADINGDGVPDVLGASGDGLAVLMGGPGLSFSAPLHYARTNPTTGGLGAGGYYSSQMYDVNGDGIPDAVDAGPNGIYIAYGHRDGTYGSAFAPEVTEYIGYPTVADFNGDGIPDIAATGDTAIKLSLGKGDGTFAAPVALPNNSGAINFSTPLSATNAHIVHGDFNGDGKIDLLALGSSSIYEYDSYLLFGNGDGTFKEPVLVPNTSNIYPMYESLVDSAVVDINKDGKSDLLSYGTDITPGGQGYIGFALSNGDGTFNAVTTTVPTDLYNGYPVMSLPALADFNGDGKLNAVYGAYTNAYVVKGNGDGTFDPTPTILGIPPIANDPALGVNSVATGDLDGDGNQDFVVLMQYASNSTYYPTPLFGAAWAFFGDGKGGFSAPVLAATFDRSYSTITVGDLNRDGRAEIVVKTSGSLGGGYALGVIESLPGRTFGPEMNYAVGTGESSLAIVDLNGDGWPDMVIGNGDYNVLASSVTLLMNLGNPDVVSGNLFATPEPSVVTQPFTLKATLTPPTPGTLDGNVGFLIDGNAVGTAALTANVATLPVAGTYAVGQHALEATWAGNASYPSLTLSGTHLVVAASTATTLTSSLNPAPAGTSVTFTATVSSSYGTPTGTVTLTDGTTVLGTLTLSGGIATYSTSSLAVGTHTIAASYAANGNFAASSASLIEVINGLTSGTSLSAAPNPAYVGQAVTLSAKVSGTPGTPTGSVSFTDGTAVIGSAAVNASDIATLSTTFATAGIHNLTAAYGGDSVFSASVSSVYAENVLLNPTGIAISATPNPAAAFQTVNFTATVTSTTGYVATGTVTFLANGTAMGTGTLQSGKAFFSISGLAAGTYAITASYGGSAGASASTSAPFTLIVGQESSTIALTTSVNPALLGAAVTFMAQVGTPAGPPAVGTVQFFDGGVLLSTVALNGQATATYTTSALALGTHPISAVYSGDADVLGIASAVLDESIVAYVGDFSISANPVSTSIYPGQTARFQVTVNGTGGFNEPVTLACTGLPAETTCNLSPVVIANGQGTSTLTFQTSAPQRVSAIHRPGLLGKSGRAAIALASLVFVFTVRRRRWLGWVALLVLGLGLGMSACGGPAAIAGGTPVGTCTVTVTGSYAAPGAPSLTHSTNVMLDVKSLF